MPDYYSPEIDHVRRRAGGSDECKPVGKQPEVRRLSTDVEAFHRAVVRGPHLFAACACAEERVGRVE